MVSVQSFLQEGALRWCCPLSKIVQAKVYRFPVNPDAFCILLEKVRLYKQQRVKTYVKQTFIQHLQSCISKTDEVIYLITLYLKEGEKACTKKLL